MKILLMLCLVLSLPLTAQPLKSKERSLLRCLRKVSLVGSKKVRGNTGNLEALLSHLGGNYQPEKIDSYLESCKAIKKGEVLMDLNYQTEGGIDLDAVQRFKSSTPYCHATGVRATVSPILALTVGTGAFMCTNQTGRKFYGVTALGGAGMGFGVTVGVYSVEHEVDSVVDYVLDASNRVFCNRVRCATGMVATKDMQSYPELPAVVSFTDGYEDGEFYGLIGLNFGHGTREGHLRVPLLPGGLNYKVLSKFFFKK